MAKTHKAELDEAVLKLEQLMAQREALETAIAKQKKRVAAWHQLVENDEDGVAPVGLVEGITDACRTVLRAAEQLLYPIEVKTRVEALGLPAQQNLLASVHTVIRRLVAANEIEEVDPVGGSGPIAYRWRRPVLPPFLRHLSKLRKA